ncbi:MAG: NADP-dependent phosphogluconate dehydrogenase [Myxococcales bacterium]|nr:MAG: NADP-dependent phosphogluconate dehydrogenase [Myxococcales bacterium]
MAEFAVGMVGLGVMGRNLSYNMAEKGFPVAAWDAWPDPVDRFIAEANGLPVGGFKDLAQFVASLSRPRRIVLLVKAGEVTDKAIASLVPHLEHGDILIDGGNEHFTNTERRATALAEKGIRYFGMGVSGGEEGARHGPSMMPGGDREAYQSLEPVFTKIAAQVADGPCVTYIGPGGAGHYVKMVHNGIEYGDMQLIAEAYSVLKQIGGLTNAELADVFTEWNNAELQSFLIEITADIFRTKDPEGPGELVDAVLDAASMKGTGKWTVQDAADVGVSIPTIATSVDARVLSANKAQRVATSKVLPGPKPSGQGVDKAKIIADVRAALYASKACSYAQGMQLLRAASDQRKWGLRLSELARIWQGGCIIRAQFLTRIKKAYEQNPDLDNLLLDPGFVEELASRQAGWRSTIARAVEAGLPLLTMGASLSYYDTIRTERLPANLIQAQRDLFGAHTYKRLDRDGDFHSKWR